MTVGKMQATADGKMLAFSSGKIMAECCCGALPEISLTGSLDFYGVECDTDTDVQNAEASNVGAKDSILTWARTLDLDASLVGNMTALPASGGLAEGDSDTIVVSLDKTTLGAGTFTGTLTVTEQLLTGVLPAELPITVQIDTYASFPSKMSLFGLEGAPAFILFGFTDQAKSQNATYCVNYPQVLNRKRTDGDWIIDNGTLPGPIEMWYNPAYAWESKYIYQRGTKRYFVQESNTSPWTGPWPYTWNRGPEPATVAI